MPMLKKVTFAVALALSYGAHAAVTEKPSTLTDQQSVAVTIYNDTLALVKDQRRVSFEAGRNRLALREVSGRMRPETALLRSLSHPGTLALVEQNFDFDLLTPAKLLEKYVGRQVKVFRMNPKTGEESFETATVLAASGGVVMRIGDRIETGLPGRIVYDGVPANLRDKPTLVTELDAARGGVQQLELSYLSGGLSWKADYVAELNGADTALEMALMGRHPYIGPFQLEGPADLAIARESLEATGTLHLAERSYMALSGGEKMRRLVIFGVAGIAAGAAIHALGICPIVKRIWTPSWTLFSTGWVVLLLAACYYVIDLKGYRRWVLPFLVVGMNSIAMYVLVHVATDYVTRSLRIHVGPAPFETFGAVFAPVLYGACALLLFWLILFWMYRRRVFVRI